LMNEEVLEDYVMMELKGTGWSVEDASGLPRDDLENPLIEPLLEDSIRRINPGITDADIKQVMDELKRNPTTFEGCRRVLEYLKHGVNIKSDGTGEHILVRILDHENPENNTFTASRQVPFRGREQNIRTDIILFINGIPAVNIELKDPTNLSVDWRDAYRQIKRYMHDVPELYKYVQIGVAAEEEARYFAVSHGTDDPPTFRWREGERSPIDSMICLLRPQRVLDFIRNYIHVREEAGLQTKVIARYMQYHASERIVKRVLDRIRGMDDRDRGLIWHWQGSGKTLTMIFAANKLYHLPELENPTIMFMVDRRDLEDQFYTEFNALDASCLERIGNIKDLRRFIRHDEYRGGRGLFITLIQKFNPGKLKEIQEELEGRKDTIMDRKNVIVFIDEAHRTQYGTLASQMKSILRSAFFFGFTGTPIARKDRNTYREFAYPPRERYLHQYFITDSIRDGFTVRIVYRPRILRGVRLDRESLETFTELEMEELPEDVRNMVEERVKERINIINAFLEAPERIERVAEDILKHFQEEVEGRFKAMIVAPSRAACVYYKDAIDRLLQKEDPENPGNYSEIIMTYGDYQDDEKNKVIQSYLRRLRDRYHGKEPDDIKEIILERFRDPQRNPQILIVTDMLLTGFDAPILQTMYLDKPLKEHKLLQAVARTNRPYRDLKEAGVIIDYIGVIEEELRRAFEVYANEEEYTGAIYDMAHVKDEFRMILRDTLMIFRDIKAEGMEALSEALEILTEDPELEKRFVNNYLNLRRLFEVLGSDPDKLDFLDDYRWLTEIYSYYLKAVARDTELDELADRYFRRTIEIIHSTTEFKEIDDSLPVVEFDENYLEELNRKVEDVRKKAADIVFTLNRFVLADKDGGVYHDSIVDKVERLLEEWRKKNKDYEEIYRHGAEIFREIRRDEERRRKLGFSKLEYSILKTLEGRGLESEDAEELTREISDNVDEVTFPGWSTQMSVRKKLGKNILRLIIGELRNFDAAKDLSDRVMNIIERYKG